MLGKMDSKRKDTKNKSSKELLKERATPEAESIDKGGRATKYPRTAATRRMNIFVPGSLHKQLRLTSANHEQSMNEIIIDLLMANLKDYESQQ